MWPTDDAPGPDLVANYLATLYLVRSPGGERLIRIGEPVPAAWLGADPGEPFVLITAWNPRSARRTEHENRRAQAELFDALDAAGARRWPALGRDSADTWREESALAVGLAPARSDALACRFGQHAVVAGVLDAPARLRCYVRAPARPPASVDTPFVDWVACAALPESRR